jgi:hypothetical protein
MLNILLRVICAKKGTENTGFDDLTAAAVTPPSSQIPHKAFNPRFF